MSLINIYFHTRLLPNVNFYGKLIMEYFDFIVIRDVSVDSERDS